MNPLNQGLLPVIVTYYTGYSGAIFLSIVALGLFIPKIISVIMANWYILNSIIYLRYQRDAVNINKCKREDLQLLPGIGRITSEKIIVHRPFKDAFELVEKLIISKGQYLSIKSLILISGVDTIEPLDLL